MKKNSENKAHENLNESSHKVKDLTKDLKENSKESEADILKNVKESRKSATRTIIVVLIILGILAVIVGFIIRANLEIGTQNINPNNDNADNADINLKETLSQINTNYVVDINRLGFIPTMIEINKGDTVMWKNQNFSSHKIIFDVGDIQGFNIDKLGNYSITFDKTGFYEYHSITQIYMKGKIKVKDS